MAGDREERYAKAWDNGSWRWEAGNSTAHMVWGILPENVRTRFRAWLDAHDAKVRSAAIAEERERAAALGRDGAMSDERYAKAWDSGPWVANAYVGPVLSWEHQPESVRSRFRAWLDEQVVIGTNHPYLAGWVGEECMTKVREAERRGAERGAAEMRERAANRCDDRASEYAKDRPYPLPPADRGAGAMGQPLIGCRKCEPDCAQPCGTCGGIGRVERWCTDEDGGPCPDCGSKGGKQPRRLGDVEPLNARPWLKGCHSDDDGMCSWEGCPQLRDGEPAKSGRHCPLDRRGDEE